MVIVREVLFLPIEADTEWFITGGRPWGIEADFERVIELVSHLKSGLLWKIKVFLLNAAFCSLPTPNLSIYLVLFVFDCGFLPAGVNHDYIFATKLALWIVRGHHWILGRDEFMWVGKVWVCVITHFLHVAFRCVVVLEVVLMQGRVILVVRIIQAVLRVFKMIASHRSSIDWRSISFFLHHPEHFKWLPKCFLLRHSQRIQFFW